MARNGSGTYSLPSGNPVTSGTAISSTVHNNTMADIATALTASIANDGQTVPVANLPMGGFKHTGCADGSAVGDSATVKQVQNSFGQQLTLVSGTNTIVGTATPTPAAYVAGQRFSFVSAGANTGAVTLNVSSLGAKSVTMRGATDLAAGDIVSGALVIVEYDGTQFQIINPATLLLSGGAIAGATAFSVGPTAPTAAVDTSTTQLATTAFVIGQAAVVAPLADATSAAIGTSKKYARADHVHPSIALGVGQSYQNVTASRTIGGGPYTNSTGKSIVIAVSCLINAADAYLNISVNGSVVGFSTQTYASGKAAIIPGFVIPPGATYSVATSAGTASSLTWIELS